jgi:hypothetical protein
MQCVGDEFEALDRLLGQPVQVLEVPGDRDDPSPEQSWQKLDLMYASMGPDALSALLRRQGLDRPSIDEALSVLGRRSRLMP